jgi:aminopeptidase N
MKPAVLLRSLGALVGDDAFQEALDTFSSEWLLKQPTPWDFFSTFERVAGMDLAWFFGPWWFETGTLDQAVARVDGAETGQATVVIENRGEIWAPAFVVGTTDTGTTVSAILALDAWSRDSRTATLSLETDGPLIRVAIDPDRLMPDVAPDNNVWVAPGGM